MKNRLLVEDAARFMNVSKRYIQVGLQKDAFSWGNAVKMSSRYTYYINPKRFAEENCIDYAEIEKCLARY